MKGWVTINTDASFHPEHKVGAFAFWIRHDQGRIIQSGPLKHCLHSLDAEIQAIGNGLYALLKSKFTDIDYIRINTDCTYAIDAIRDKKMRNATKRVVENVEAIILEVKCKYYRKLKKRRHPFIDYRYVPAHIDTSTPKKWLNDWCDTQAKNHLWKQINSNEQTKP